ncbi:MAG TPA: hypothetical protein PL167_05380 [Cyclobacteriaceae bacterium]|nr:hypothetical protein [Cyclobacteriaceae bacterium]
MIALVAGSCANYYQSTYSFNQEFESGKLDNALTTLQAKSSEANGKREFLFNVNNGLVLSMLGRYDESNEYFEKAFLFGEDYRKNYLNEAASYLTNPMITSYKGEDHEHLMLLYYKAINFLKMGKTQEALVECRRVNIRLQQLSDRYQNENKYQRDAFIHTLMGVIYDTDKDYNNAFIAYRNALEIYQDDYSRLFGLYAPEQLKKDILRTAWLSGFTNDFNLYKNEFNMPDYEYAAPEGGELVFFWHNGLSPVKAEWGINFVVDRRGNMVYFYNRELGLTFPFPLEGYDEREKNGLGSLEIFRVALPRYVERPTYYSEATLTWQGNSTQLQLLEDVNKIAFKSLQQRMDLELSKALIRVALKKVAEYQVKQEDKTLGSVLGMINAITEKADTRNWQTLPHSIFYSRISLNPGPNVLKLSLKGPRGDYSDHEFTYQANKGQILFHTFSSLESGYPNYGY